MFTGLIEEIGKIKHIVSNTKSAQLTITAKKILNGIKLGDSISTNGVCLTVIDYKNDSFTVDVMPETMRRSNLKKLGSGSKVNLERALRLGDRLGGHMVSGHVDDIGLISNIEEEENATWITIDAPSSLLRYVVEKGSIAIDGTSLTVAFVNDKCLKVSIIPLTKEETTLLRKGVGEEVNLECDMIGKYIEKFVLLGKDDQSEGKINMNFLKENGFI